MVPPFGSTTDQVTGFVAVKVTDWPNPRFAVSGAIENTTGPASPPPPPPMLMSSVGNRELPGGDEQPPANTNNNAINRSLAKIVPSQKKAAIRRLLAGWRQS